LGPRKFRRIEVDERAGVGDVTSEIAARRPAVAGLAGSDRVLEIDRVAAYLLGPVPEV